MTRWAGIMRMGGIGDNLTAASVLRPLKRMGYSNEVITSNTAGAVYRNNPFIDKLTIKADGEVPQGDAWHPWYMSRANEYDIFAHLSHTGEFRHALFNNQTAFWWRPEYRRKLCAGNYLETVHDIVGVPHEFGPLFFPTDEEQDRALRTKSEQIGDRFIAWPISGSRLDKIWPWASMAICRIIKEMGIPVVMLGIGGNQYEIAKNIQLDVQRTNSSDKGLHLALSPANSNSGEASHWDIRRSLSLALNSDLVVTPDTGIAWACAMEKMPKIMLHSHASVENITKHWINTTSLHADRVRVSCWPCHRLHNDISTCVPNSDMKAAAACISDISVEQLLTAVDNALNVNKVVPLRAA